MYETKWLIKYKENKPKRNVTGACVWMYADRVGRGHESDGVYLWVIACLWDEGGHKGEGEAGGTCEPW